jgi:hypothetical protein
MTVEQLIKSLASFPLGFQVVLARDAEGNGFAPLPEKHGVSVEKYLADEVGGTLSDSDNGMDVNAVVLWPAD